MENPRRYFPMGLFMFLLVLLLLSPLLSYGWEMGEGTGKGRRSTGAQRETIPLALGENAPSMFVAQEKGTAGKDASQSESKKEAPSEPGDRLKLGGFVWSKFSNDLKEENEYEGLRDFRSEIRLEGKYSLSENVRAVLSADFKYIAYDNSVSKEHVDPTIFDAYMDLNLGSFDIRAGRQIVRWGKTDEYSPVDNVNPQDLREFVLRDLEERKLPMWMLNATYNLKDFRIQGIFIPFFERHKIDRFGSDWAVFDHADKASYPVPFPNVREERYSNTIHNSEWGLRFLWSLWRIDFGLSYLYTRNKVPSINLDSFAGLPVPQPINVDNLLPVLIQMDQTYGRREIVLKHERTNVVGLEFETTLANFGIRGEIACFADQPYLVDDLRTIKRPLIHYVVGADYTTSTNLYLNLQFSQEIILDYIHSILFKKRFTNAVNGEVSQSLFREKLLAEVDFYYNFTTRAHYINPYITLKYIENLDLSIGLDLLWGGDDAIFSTYEKNSQFFIRAKYSF